MTTDIPGIRTRLDVVTDRLLAGVPFYWELDAWQLSLAHDRCVFMGRAVKVIDRDGDHCVLQLDEEAAS